MTITLSPDQLAWIEARVARGDYSDVDEAVRDLLAAGIEAYAEVEHDDMAWAKPLVDEALAELARGEFTVIDDIDTFLKDIFHPEHGWWLGSTSVRPPSGIWPAS